MTMGQMALRWILDDDGVTCAIPGGKRPDQVESNCAAADLPPLTSATHQSIAELYDRLIRSHVHDRW